MAIIPVSIFIHIAFSWWIYTDQNVFPAGVSISTNGNPMPRKISTGQRLFTTEQGIPFFIFFILTALYYLAQYLVTEINFFIEYRIRKKWQ